MQPIRTLLIIPTINPLPLEGGIGAGGSERMTRNLCLAFDRARIEPMLLTFSDPGEAGAELEAAGVKLFQLQKRGKVDLRFWLALYRLIVRQKINAVFSMLQGTNLHNLIVTSQLPKVARLISYRGGTVNHQLAATEGRLAYLADAMVVPARHLIAELSQKYRIRESKIHAIPNGCDHKRFVYRPYVERVKYREQLGLPPDAFILYTPSRIAHAKGQDVMATALMQVRDLLTTHAVLWINTGHMQDQSLAVQIDATTREVVRHVRLLPQTPEPELWMAAADVVVIPSRVEAFPNILLEAAFTGRPFIATSCGEVPEVVKRIGGSLVAPESSLELAMAMRELITMLPEQRAELGAALSEKAHQHYSIGQAADRFARVIEQAVAGRRGKYL